MGDPVLQWEVSIPPAQPPDQRPPVLLPVHLLYFWLFTKVQRGQVGAGEGVCKGLLPTGVEKGKEDGGMR